MTDDTNLRTRAIGVLCESGCSQYDRLRRLFVVAFLSHLDLLEFN